MMRALLYKITCFGAGSVFLASCGSNSYLVGWEPMAVPSQVARTLAGAEPGQTVEVPDFDLSSAPRMPYQTTILPSPQYLISDDPEYIRVPEAVALREQVEPGDVRLYVYNVNGLEDPEMPTRISPVIENNGDEPMTVTFRNYSFQGPTTNYYHAGKNGLRDFWAREYLPEPFVVSVGGSAPLDERSEASVANYNDLVHGFYEFTIDQPATVSVVQTDPETPSTVANARIAEPLPTRSHSGAGRGKFSGSNIAVKTPSGYVMDSAHGPVQLVIADGDSDPWVTGTESTLPDAEAVLKGNYGVMYDIEIPYTSSDGRGLALVTWNYRFNPEAWCGGMAACVVVNDGIHSGGIVLVPDDQLLTKSAPECVLIQTFPAAKSGIVRLTYSPPGASCLPTPLVFVPVILP